MTAVLAPPPLQQLSANGLSTLATRSLATCPSFIGAQIIRVTAVDGCGRPTRGPRSQAVSEGIIQIETSPEVSEGQDYSQTLANGRTCANQTGPDTLKWLNVSVQFCQVDFDLFTLVNPSWKRVTNAARTQTTGTRMGTRFDTRIGFALEVWPIVADADVGCDDADELPVDPDDPIVPSGYFLMPWVIARAPDSWTNQNGVVTFTLRGRTRSGSRWGRGPYDVTRDINGSPAPLLDPIEDGRGSSGIRPFDPDHFHMELVSVAPPQAVCGAQPLPPAVEITQVSDADPFQWQVAVNNRGDLMPNGTQAATTITWHEGTETTTSTINTATGTATHTFTGPGLHKIVVESASDDPANPLRRVVRFVSVEVVTAVTVTPDAPTIEVGETVQLTATATLDVGAGEPEERDVTAEATWSPQAGAVAYTSTTGLVRGVTAGGPVVITAAYKGQQDTASVTVTAAALAAATASTTRGLAVDEGDQADTEQAVVDEPDTKQTSRKSDGTTGRRS